MKKLFLLAVTITLALHILAQSFTPVDEISKVTFKVRNFGFTVDGSLKGIKGTIDFDPSNLSNAKFDVSIDANTINTDNNMRDNHLREDSYFDVKNHPLIHFVSTKVTPSNKAGTLFMFGKLEIKGVSKDISFPFTATPAGGGFIFKGEFKINRRDFNVGGSSTISNDVIVNLEVAAKK